MDLLHLDQGRLRNAADAERFLVQGERNYAGPWIQFTRPRWPEWGRLTEHLQSREETVLSADMTAMTVERARSYHQATYSIGMGAGHRFAKHVDLSGRRQLLDLGGGSGAYSIVATRKFPGLRATVLDLPAVVEVTREFVAAAGAQERVDTLAGDFTSTEFPSADVVLMASNLPQYSSEIIGTVVAKAFAALEPGGEMHLIGEMLAADGVGPLGPALWGLAEAVAHTTGRAHSESECVGYFRRAGFERVHADPFVAGTLTRVSGFKPRR